VDRNQSRGRERWLKPFCEMRFKDWLAEIVFQPWFAEWSLINPRSFVDISVYAAEG